jgi:hypothetical protein
MLSGGKVRRGNGPEELSGIQSKVHLMPKQHCADLRPYTLCRWPLAVNKRRQLIANCVLESACRSRSFITRFLYFSAS